MYVEVNEFDVDNKDEIVLLICVFWFFLLFEVFIFIGVVLVMVNLFEGIFLGVSVVVDEIGVFGEMIVF